MIKLTKERTFKPSVLVGLDNGDIVNNMDLPRSEAIYVEYELASVSEKQRYEDRYSENDNGVIKSRVVYDKETAISKNVIRVTGLEKYGITTGKAMMNYETNDVLNSIIDEAFFRIMGYQLPTITEDEDKADFAPGEPKASD